MEYNNKGEFYWLKIFGRVPYLSAQVAKPVIVDVLTKNKAKIGRDYVVEVVDE